MPTFRSTARLCLILGSLAAIAGCGPSEPYEMVPISGVVTLDGRPLSNARLAFQPLGGGGGKKVGPGSYGRSDEQGRFTLETVDRRSGAVVGEHLVTVTTQAVVSEDAGNDATVMTRETVPEHLRNGFKLKVEGETEDLQVELSSQQGG